MIFATLYGHQEEGSVYATGCAPDGSSYLAVADDWEKLHACIRDSAKAEGWTGWALLTGTRAMPNGPAGRG